MLPLVDYHATPRQHLDMPPSLAAPAGTDTHYISAADGRQRAITITPLRAARYDTPLFTATPLILAATDDRYQEYRLSPPSHTKM